MVKHLLGAGCRVGYWLVATVILSPCHQTCWAKTSKQLRNVRRQNVELSGMTARGWKLFNEPTEQLSGSPIRRLWSVTIKKSWKTKDPHGGDTVRGLNTYQAVSHSWNHGRTHDQQSKHYKATCRSLYSDWKETLEELYRIHLLDSNMTDDALGNNIWIYRDAKQTGTIGTWPERW